MDLLVSSCVFSLVSKILNPLPFFKDFFLIWAILKVFVEFITILPLFYVSGFGPRDVWEVSWLPDQGLNPDPLHSKAVLTTNHQGIPRPLYSMALASSW